MDAAAVSAFHDVARFEAPPPALIDATGTATAHNLRFTVDLGYNGFDWDLRHFPGLPSPPPPSLHALRTWARAEGCSEAPHRSCPAALALAAALQERGRPATALAVLRTVPDRSPAMLRGFVEASEALGDTSDLAELALEVPADRVPEALRPTFDYHRVRALERAGRDHEARTAAERIEPSSPYYWRAQLVAGVLSARAGRLKTAVRMLTEVVDGMGPEPKRDSAEAQLKHVAISNIARIYYGLHQFDEARKHWSRVPEWSPEWDDAALGMAWTDRMSGARVPELVEAWSPAVEQLEGALQYVGFAKAYDALDLPKPLRRRIEADEGVRGLRAHLAQITRERLWGDVVLLDGERARVTQRLDARLSGRVRCEVGRLRDGWGLDVNRRDCEVLDATAPRRR